MKYNNISTNVSLTDARRSQLNLYHIEAKVFQIIQKKKLSDIVFNPKNIKVIIISSGNPNYLRMNQTSSLRYCVDDALKMAEVFKSYEGGKIPEENITLLLENEANSTSFQKAIDNIKDQIKTGEQVDSVYIVYSGHADKQHCIYLEDQPITTDDYLDQTNSLNTKVVHIHDACESAAMLDSSKFKKHKDVAFMSSSVGQSSYEHSILERGLFSICLTLGFSYSVDKANNKFLYADLNLDGNINFQELSKFINHSYEVYYDGINQTPVFHIPANMMTDVLGFSKY